MAANTPVRTFWDVFVTLLLKMAAYFGLAVPASRGTAPAAPRPETVPGTRFLPTAEAVRHWAPAPRTEPAPRPVAVGAAASGPGLPVEPGARTPEVPPSRTSSHGSARGSSRRSTLPTSLPASLPSAFPSNADESVVPEPSLGLEPALCLGAATGARELSLPPTMKQRIRAEAHGASPVARVRTRPIGDAGLEPALSDVTEAPARAPRRREWALCA
ncbi:DUF6344 domain-containing protein [Streptomyces sp. ME01-24h]|nr:DUF6344 domain-containing protein [Streptomyces sp. ME19-03-3]MDX3352056.1 DUF6344 domain-containing protein [Streptomyces sp. ME01-24h]